MTAPRGVRGVVVRKSLEVDQLLLRLALAVVQVQVQVQVEGVLPLVRFSS